MALGNRLRRFLQAGAVLAEPLDDINRLRKRYTVNGNPIPVETPFGGPGLWFDGTNDDVDCGLINAVNFGTGSFTCIARVKYTDDTNFRTIMGNRAVGPGAGYQLDIRSSRIGAAIEDTGGTSAPFAQGSAFNDGEWHNFVWVIDRTDDELRGYVDGSQQGSAVDISGIADITSTANFKIGNCDSGGNWLGSIKDVIIFPRELPDGEIEDFHYGRLF